MELSICRAWSILAAMVAARAPENDFVYEGRGGTERVASNDTQNGRARNCPVEIIILED